jgi:hypothetical protein
MIFPRLQSAKTTAHISGAVVACPVSGLKLLLFLDFLRQFDAADHHGRRLESLEPEHRPDSLFYSPVILLDYVVSCAPGFSNLHQSLVDKMNKLWAEAHTTEPVGEEETRDRPFTCTARRSMSMSRLSLIGFLNWSIPRSRLAKGRRGTEPPFT